MIDLEEFPKGYDANADLWESEGEWRRYMICIYTQRVVQ